MSVLIFLAILSVVVFLGSWLVRWHRYNSNSDTIQVIWNPDNGADVLAELADAFPEIKALSKDYDYNTMTAKEYEATWQTMLAAKEKQRVNDLIRAERVSKDIQYHQFTSVGYGPAMQDAYSLLSDRAYQQENLIKDLKAQNEHLRKQARMLMNFEFKEVPSKIITKPRAITATFSDWDYEEEESYWHSSIY